MKETPEFHRIDRSKINLLNIHQESWDFVDLSPAQCLEMMWELTREIWSLRDSEIAERRLQRDVTNLVRKKTRKPPVEKKTDLMP